jgi:Protein of unknown function (DUF5131)
VGSQALGRHPPQAPTKLSGVRQPLTICWELPRLQAIPLGDHARQRGYSRTIPPQGSRQCAPASGAPPSPRAGYPNVWLLVSVDQAGLDRDVPKLLEIPAVVRGLSIQPQLAPVRFGKFAGLLQWVINGGASGAGARPFHLRRLRPIAARVLHTTGDSILVEFPSVVDAMRCAAEVQRGKVDLQRSHPSQ